MSALEDAAVLSQGVRLPHESCDMQVRANQHEGHQGEIQPVRASQGSSGSAAQAGGHSVDKVRKAARPPGCPGRCHAWTPSFTPAVTHQGAPGAEHPASIRLAERQAWLVCIRVMAASSETCSPRLL